ncbi:MAG: CoA pyrophosphatase, partial [Chloroflexi bacterium]|nr:CoA pyrophosphatase [Chloroflexota bacterium]
LVDDHKGEVSFPGGAFHHGQDTSLQMTALRENHEEIGVHPDNVLIVGELDDIITRSNYIISPFVGFLRAPQEYIPAPAEVAEVLEAPLEWLLDPANVRDAEQTPRHYAGRPVNGQYYEFNDSVIYGATFRILRQFLSLLPPGIR